MQTFTVTDNIVFLLTLFTNDIDRFEVSGQKGLWHKKDRSRLSEGRFQNIILDQ